MTSLKSNAPGLYATESLILIAERVMAALQDAGVTHIRDVAIYLTPADRHGVRLEVATADGPVTTLGVDCTGFALPMAATKPAARYPAAAPRGPRRGPRRTRAHDRRE